MSKIYKGKRADGGAVSVIVVESGGGIIKTYSLPHIVLHSPTGFEWGYEGSGPADLALSILAEHLGDKPNAYELRQGYFAPTEAELKPPSKGDLDDKRLGVPLRPILSLRMHQQFKTDVIAKLPHGDWEITDQQVAEWVEKYQGELNVKKL